MTIDVSIELRDREVRKMLRRLPKAQIPQATATALNRTNRGVRTDITRGIAGATGLQQKRVRRRAFIPRGHPKFNASRHRLRAGGLILFNYVPEAYVVGPSKRARKAAQGPNKFVATMPSGHTGLFSRTRSPKRVGEGARKRPKARRSLPITESLVDLSREASDATDRIIETSARRRFRREFARALSMRLKRTR